MVFYTLVVAQCGSDQIYSHKGSTTPKMMAEILYSRMKYHMYSGIYAPHKIDLSVS